MRTRYTSSEKFSLSSGTSCLNAQDKVYLRKAMITADKNNKTGVSDNNKLKMDPAVVDGDNKAIRFAKQCINLCSDRSQKRVL